MLDAARRQRILKKAEKALVISLKNNYSQKKIRAAAEKLREAKLSLFKGQLEITKYKEDLKESEQKHLDNLAIKNKEWREKSVQEIIDEYNRIYT